MISTPIDTSVPIFTELLNRYETDQRILITKRADILLLISTVVGFGGNLEYIFSNPKPTTLLPIPAIIGLLVAIASYSTILLIAYFLANKRRIELASSFTVLGCMILVVGIQIVWIIVAHQQGQKTGLDDQSWSMFLAYIVPIALAVVIGNRAVLYVTVVALNIISTIVLYYAFYSTGYDLSSRHQFIGLWLTAIMTEWAITLIILAMRTGFRRIIFDASKLQYAVDRAKQLDDLKDQFISSVNHELRNPVMALRGYLDALQQLDPTMPMEQRQRFIIQAVYSCQNVQDMIESILSVRRIDQSLANLHMETVTINSVVNTAASQIDPREATVGERELHLKIPENLTVWADRIRLQQIVTNLLSNAIKYSTPGTAIEVTARQIASQDLPTNRTRKEAMPNLIEIEVRDHGFGVPPEQIPLLFQKFVRLPRDLGSTIVGNGLGLFACKEIAEALHGEIWLESTGVAGEGSTFFVRLPATANDALLSIPPHKEAITSF